MYVKKPVKAATPVPAPAQEKTSSWSSWFSGSRPRRSQRVCNILDNHGVLAEQIRSFKHFQGCPSLPIRQMPGYFGTDAIRRRVDLPFQVPLSQLNHFVMSSSKDPLAKCQKSFNLDLQLTLRPQIANFTTPKRSKQTAPTSLPAFHLNSSSDQNSFPQPSHLRITSLEPCHSTENCSTLRVLSLRLEVFLRSWGSEMISGKTCSGGGSFLVSSSLVVGCEEQEFL